MKFVNLQLEIVSFFWQFKMQRPRFIWSLLHFLIESQLILRTNFDSHLRLCNSIRASHFYVILFADDGGALWKVPSSERLPSFSHHQTHPSLRCLVEEKKERQKLYASLISPLFFQFLRLFFFGIPKLLSTCSSIQLLVYRLTIQLPIFLRLRCAFYLLLFISSKGVSPLASVNYIQNTTILRKLSNYRKKSRWFEWKCDTQKFAYIN